jgi:hypothetical protein
MIVNLVFAAIKNRIGKKMANHYIWWLAILDD